MSLSSWIWLMAWLAVELAALVAGAAVLQVFFRSPQSGRMLWQAAFTSMALVLIVEFSGLRGKIPIIDSKQQHHFVITTTVLPPDGREVWAAGRAAEVAPVVVPAPAVVKWPGWIWLAGAALLLARSLAARVWLALCRRAAASADGESLRMIGCLQMSLGLRGVQSQVWPGLRSPVAFGIVRPAIALPPDFIVRFSAAERQAMLAHEMAHLAGRDPFWLMVSDTVIALAWWHPLVWWARHKLQIASEAAADEASALIPGGPCALAECLVRLGRELTGSGPARALGVGGNGPRSQLATRIARLLREPQAWRPSSGWARWTPHLSAIVVALASAILPIQTGLSGSILAMLAAAVPVRAETPPAVPVATAVTNQPPANTSNDVVAVTNTPAHVVVLTNIQAGQSPTFSVVATGSGALSYQWNFDGSNISAADQIAKIKEQAVTILGDSPLIDRLFTTNGVLVTNTSPFPDPSFTYQWYFNGSNISAAPVTNVQAAQGVTFNAVATGSGPITYQWYSNGSNISGATDLAPIATQLGTSDQGKSPPPKVKLLVQAVTVTERDSDEIGLDWVFGLAPSNNPAVETSHNWSDLRMLAGGATNNHPRNLVLDKLHNDGQSVVLKREQFGALRERILARTGDDLLTAPTILTLSGRQAHIAIQDANTIVTGVEEARASATNSAGINYLTDDIRAGFAVDVIPTAQDNDNWRLRVQVDLLNFLGYEKNKPGVLETGGTPVKYDLPMPHFRVLESSAEDTVPLGQTLAIRGPLWTETTKTKAHFFTRAKTKTTRQRLYIFVTPTRPPADSN
jgi:beta-lactamase regulating signal transducer with metallopeptidase domain